MVSKDLIATEEEPMTPDEEAKMLLAYDLEKPEYGDLMTIDEFIDNCKMGAIIDYDGYGKYTTVNGITDLYVYPSEIMEGIINRKFTHVVWFNK